VAFIGLGQIGAPMAKHLLAWPGGLVVSDLRAEATLPFAEAGATVATSLTILAASHPSVVSIMVLNDDQVRSVVTELLAAVQPGTVLAVHSTIRPETAVELSAVALEHGCHLVDAPVSGGFMGAHDGRLAVMIGGSDEAAEACRGPFERFAELIVHVGPAGHGTRAKLARNLLSFSAFAVAAESQRLAEAAGIDLLELARIVKHSDSLTGGPGSIMLRSATAPMAADDGLRPILEHTRTLGNKDLDLALELGTQLGVDLPFATLARERFGIGLGLDEPTGEPDA